MKAFEIAEDFRHVIEADSAFTGIHTRTGQTDEDLKHPSIVFECAVRPVGGSASVLTFELTMTVQSEAHDSTGANHAARVELLRAKFFGANAAGLAAARAAMKTAFQARGHFTLLGRGCDAPHDPSGGSVEMTRFKTPVVVAGTVKVAPAV